MADRINMELSDDVFEEVSGGLTGQNGSEVTQYDALGTVFKHIGDRDYEVHLSDGAQVVATSVSDNIVHDGAPVGLIAKAGGWAMYEIIR